MNLWIRISRVWIGSQPIPTSNSWMRTKENVSMKWGAGARQAATRPYAADGPAERHVAHSSRIGGRADKNALAEGGRAINRHVLFYFLLF